MKMCCSTTAVNANLKAIIHMQMCVWFGSVLLKKEKSGYDHTNITNSIQVINI